MTDYMCPADPTVTHCYHAAKVNEIIRAHVSEITALRAEVERLKVEAAAQYADGAHDGSDRAQDLWAGEITALRAENERLKIENIQMQAALGYGILAEDERHILPSNPFKCGTCDASKHLRAENERLRQVLENNQQARVLQGKAITDASNEIEHLRAENERLRAALEEVRVLVFGANRSEARYPLARAALEEKP